MMGIEKSTSRKTLEQKNNYKMIKELTKWLTEDYRREMDAIERAHYLGYPYPITKRDLMVNAYDVEQKLRRLKGMEPLQEIRFTDFI